MLSFKCVNRKLTHLKDKEIQKIIENISLIIQGVLFNIKSNFCEIEI